MATSVKRPVYIHVCVCVCVCVRRCVCVCEREREREERERERRTDRHALCAFVAIQRLEPCADVIGSAVARFDPKDRRRGVGCEVSNFAYLFQTCFNKELLLLRHACRIIIFAVVWPSGGSRGGPGARAPPYKNI